MASTETAPVTRIRSQLESVNGPITEENDRQVAQLLYDLSQRGDSATAWRYYLQFTGRFVGEPGMNWQTLGRRLNPLTKNPPVTELDPEYRRALDFLGHLPDDFTDLFPPDLRHELDSLLPDSLKPKGPLPVRELFSGAVPRLKIPADLLSSFFPHQPRFDSVKIRANLEIDSLFHQLQGLYDLALRQAPEDKIVPHYLADSVRHALLNPGKWFMRFAREPLLIRKKELALLLLGETNPPDPPSVRLLTHYLGHSDAHLRKSALQALARMNFPFNEGDALLARLLSALSPLVENSDPQTRLWMFRILAPRRDAASIRLLTRVSVKTFQGATPYGQGPLEAELALVASRFLASLQPEEIHFASQKDLDYFLNVLEEHFTFNEGLNASEFRGNLARFFRSVGALSRVFGYVQDLLEDFKWIKLRHPDTRPFAAIDGHRGSIRTSDAFRSEPEGRVSAGGSVPESIKTAIREGEMVGRATGIFGSGVRSRPLTAFHSYQPAQVLDGENLARSAKPQERLNRLSAQRRRSRNRLRVFKRHAKTSSRFARLSPSRAQRERRTPRSRLFSSFRGKLH